MEFETDVLPVGTGVQSLALGSNYEWDPSPVRWKRSLKGGGDVASGPVKVRGGAGGWPLTHLTFVSDTHTEKPLGHLLVLQNQGLPRDRGRWYDQHTCLPPKQDHASSKF